MNPLFYALTFKTITQNKFTCSVISRYGPFTELIPFPIVMLVLGVQCLRFNFNRQNLFFRVAENQIHTNNLNKTRKNNKISKKKQSRQKIVI